MRADGKMTLVVTGGIGSGKSLVCSMFADKGIPVYDSDSRTKSLYDSVPGLPARISSALGADVTTPGGLLDRRRLADVIFSDPARLAVLESIVHPEVKKDFLKWRESFSGTAVPLVIMESAIILEKPVFRDIMDKVLVVDAPFGLRLERAMGRDNADAATVRRRMESQKLLNGISDGIVPAEIDFLIVNDGDIDSLSLKVDRLFMKLVGTTGNQENSDVFNR